MKITYTEEEVKEIVKSHALGTFSTETMGEIKDKDVVVSVDYGGFEVVFLEKPAKEL